MNIQELYDLMSKRLDEMSARTDARLDEMSARTDARLEEMSARTDARFSEVITRLEGIDDRLRGVETKVAELQGRKMGISTVRDWIVGLSAVCALLISLIALLK